MPLRRCSHGVYDPKGDGSNCSLCKAPVTRSAAPVTRTFQFPQQQEVKREPTFDRSAFDNRRSRAVSKDSRIAFSDFGRMHVESSQGSGKMSEAPAWAMNDDLLAQVIVAYLERRYYINTTRRKRIIVGDISPERMDTIRAKAQGMVKAKLEILKRLLATHAATPSEPLEAEIQSLDTDICITERIDRLVAAIPYLYWRTDYNSVQIAQELHIKSPHVRQVLNRLNVVWLRMQDPDEYQERPSFQTRRRSTVDVRRAVALRKQGKRWEQIADAFGTTKSMVMRAVDIARLRGELPAEAVENVEAGN